MKKNIVNKKETKQTKKVVNAADVMLVPESLSSVKLEKAAGEVRPTIHVRHEDPDEAYKQAKKLMDKALKDFKVEL